MHPNFLGGDAGIIALEREISIYMLSVPYMLLFSIVYAIMYLSVSNRIVVFNGWCIGGYNGFK